MMMSSLPMVSSRLDDASTTTSSALNNRRRRNTKTNLNKKTNKTYTTITRCQTSQTASFTPKGAKISGVGKALPKKFITNDDLDMTHTKARRRLLWQLTSRFDVGRGLTFDDDRSRLCWDATTPIPSEEHGVRRWPAVTLHDEETLAKVAAHPELKKYEWPPHLSFGGPE